MHLTNLQKEILEKKGFDLEDEKQNNPQVTPDLDAPMSA